MPDELYVDLSALTGRWNKAADMVGLVRVIPQLADGEVAIFGPFHLQRRGSVVSVVPLDPVEPQHGTVRLRRAECLVLPLVLKGRWYRMIESGRKREEYRDLTRYWHERLLRFNRQYYEARKKRVVEFRLGYATDAPRMAWEIVPVGPYGESCYAVLNGRRDGGEEFGEPAGYHFSIQLGRRVEWEDETTGETQQ